MTEREFERTVLETLRLCGWRFTHFRPAQTNRGWRTPLSGDAGFPDVVATRNDGRLLFLELKTDVGGLTQEQANWLSALGTAGAEVHVLRPSDWDAFVEWVR
jgi:hypothetical protein